MDQRTKSELDKLTHTDAGIKAMTLGRFGLDFDKKFDAGGKKYTTPLIKKDLPKNAWEEVLDLSAYLTAIQARDNLINKVLEMWRNSDIEGYLALGAIHEIMNTQPDGKIE